MLGESDDKDRSSFITRQIFFPLFLIFFRTIASPELSPSSDHLLSLKAGAKIYTQYLLFQIFYHIFFRKIYTKTINHYPSINNNTKYFIPYHLKNEYIIPHINKIPPLHINVRGGTYKELILLYTLHFIKSLTKYAHNSIHGHKYIWVYPFGNPQHLQSLRFLHDDN